MANTCPECGSTKVVQGVRVGHTAEAGRVGLSYHTKLLVLPIVGTEPLLADVCDGCGLIVRLYVQSVGKPWVQNRE